ncbi:MAG: family 16 glycosylhydrolase [Acidobacteriaceae bacterium]|jgi:beta-glucanase (GH16 family)|nr:family 16 glycosylhydrolase [Acidobacteriaceae bacterium]
MSTLHRRTFVKGSIVAGAGSMLGPLISSQASAAEDPTAGRTVIFDDQFRTIDWTVWDAGRKATTFDPGFYGRAAFARSTGEEGFNPYAIVNDAATANGKALQITAKYIGKEMSVPYYFGNKIPDSQWVSGNLQTARGDGTIMKGWRKGYFEARMLFPKHPLSWPAFWFMNGRSILNPKTSIEIDVVEHKGFEPKTYGAYLHEWGQPGEHHEGAGVNTPVDMTTQYCRYGVLITDTDCRPYFERQPVNDPATGKQAIWPITRAPELAANNDVFWPLLTLALHADVPFPDPLLPEHMETSMRVDYFRVYA